MDATANVCPTCGHSPDDHSDLAGCLAKAGDGWCDCTAQATAIRTAVWAERIDNGYETAHAALKPSRAQTLTEGRRRRDEGAQAAGSALPGHVDSEWRTKATQALADLIAK